MRILTAILIYLYIWLPAFTKDINCDKPVYAPKNTIDSVKVSLVQEYAFHADGFFRKDPKFPNFPTDIFLHKDTMYFLNYKDKRVILFDIRKKETFSLPAIDKFIRANSEKYYGVNKIYINDTHIYIGFLRGVFCFNKQGILVSKFTNLNYNCEFFRVINPNLILILSSEKGFILSSNGQIKKEINFDEFIINPYFKNDSIFLFESEKVRVLTNILGEIKKSSLSIKAKGFNSNSFYLSSLYEDSSLWFDYYNRNNIYMINKDFTAITKKIHITNKNFIPSKGRIAIEEGNPFFRILKHDNGDLYIITLENNSIKIFKIG